ncbi:MAG: aminotransferase class I/II-fold pyridoxal phosphate-dependent enzyme [Acidimicrobiia bacterium]|jgi:7-keto-8-aminopelargonate synthetase-like enzyme
MRTDDAAQLRRLLARYETRARLAADAGLVHVHLDDEPIRGPYVSINGRQVVSFGSCSYMALNLDPRVTGAAIEAVGRYGITYSSSTVYTSLRLYERLERLLSDITGGHVLVTPTTTLGHLAALPVLVGPGARVVVDAQAHASVHLAVQVLKAEGIPVDVLPHGDRELLVSTIAAAADRHDAVWYLADGVYSMFGDAAPVALLAGLLDRHPNLHLYLDDAHGFSWHGWKGRGWVLERMRMHPRLVVALSLSKSFGSGGGALAFGDPEVRERVRYLGGPLTFGGPLQVAELAAGVASAEIHLADEHVERRARMASHIELAGRTIRRIGLPVKPSAATPIWFVEIGRVEDTIEVGRRMLAEGHYLNPSSFPAVPIGMSGLRISHTLHHDERQIVDMLTTLASHVADVLGEDLAVEIDLRDTDMASPQVRRRSVAPPETG